MNQGANTPRRYRRSFWLGHAASAHKAVSIGTRDVALDNAASGEQAIAMIEGHLKGASTGGEGDRRAHQSLINPTTACWSAFQ